jgi:hypothetical protein
MTRYTKNFQERHMSQTVPVIGPAPARSQRPSLPYARFALACALTVAINAQGEERAAVASSHVASPPPGSPPVVQSDPKTAYREINLKALVPASRMPDGQRTIFAPTGVRFHARLMQLPTPQKTEYLQQVMSMMRVQPLPRVNQRVVIDYGGDKLLAAYVEEGAAARIGQTLKVGDSRTFYAFHVYNNRQGPALVITSFGD